MVVTASFCVIEYRKKYPESSYDELANIISLIANLNILVNNNTEIAALVVNLVAPMLGIEENFIRKSLNSELYLKVLAINKEKSNLGLIN